MKCDICRGACCESLNLEIIAPAEPDTLVWLVAHDIAVSPTHLSIPLRCTRLTSDGSCSIWNDKPKLCNEYEVGGPECLATVKSRRTPQEYQEIRDDIDPEVLV